MSTSSSHRTWRQRLHLDAQSVPRRVLWLLFGRPLANDEGEERKVTTWQGVPILGLDALGSASYGPEAALAILIPFGAAGLRHEPWIMAAIVALLVLLYVSYRQTIAAYPNGGGSFTVASENLGARAGVVAAAALLLDYILNVAVGISAGVGALESALPVLQAHRLSVCLAVLGFVTFFNLRGVRESGLAWMVPTYGFIVTLAAVLLLGLMRVWQTGGHPVPLAPPAPLHAAVASLSLWQIMRAFASGCTAMTGVETVSNGIPIFAEPRARRAQGTLTVITAVLGLFLLGIGYLSQVYQIGAMSQDEPGYQSVVSQLAGAVFGRSFLYYLTLGFVLSVLTLSANTSFAGFPRLCSLLARKQYLPPGFALVGGRLVFTTGIIVLALLSGALLVVFQGVTDRLIPLFAVGAFGAFSMSQAGMVAHWWRKDRRLWNWPLLLNAAGALATAASLLVIIVAKFAEGAWISLLLIVMIAGLCLGIRRHFRYVLAQIGDAPPLQISRAQHPIVILPIEGWNKITERAIRFSLRISNEITAIHVTPEEDNASLVELWEKLVREPARAAGITPPGLQILCSPYRQFYQPLLDYVDEVASSHPKRTIAVVIPELVQPRWWEYLLHNHAATGLKAALLFSRAERVVVISTPWFLHEPNST